MYLGALRLALCRDHNRRPTVALRPYRSLVTVPIIKVNAEDAVVDSDPQNIVLWILKISLMIANTT